MVVLNDFPSHVQYFICKKTFSANCVWLNLPSLKFQIVRGEENKVDEKRNNKSVRALFFFKSGNPNKLTTMRNLQCYKTAAYERPAEIRPKLWN